MKNEHPCGTRREYRRRALRTPRDTTANRAARRECESSIGPPCGALAQIYDALQDSGATFVGAYEPEDYQVTDSEINRDGKFIGLALDAADEDKNPERIAKWVELVK